MIGRLALLVAALAQDPPPTVEKPTAADRYRILLAELRGDDLAPAEKLSRVRTFVAEVGATVEPDDETLLTARALLGTMLMSERRLKAAATEFEHVLRSAPATDRDLRGTALYGLAQVRGLEGHRERAERLLDRLGGEFAGTRYADLADVARARLTGKSRAVIGEAAPEFGPRLDLQFKSRSLGTLAGQPALIVFWRPDPRGDPIVRRWLAAADRAGLDAEQIVVFGVSADVDRLRDTGKRYDWTSPIVAARSTNEFLDPAVLAYGVTRIPSSFLIGPTGVLAAKDLTPARLEKALLHALRR